MLRKRSLLALTIYALSLSAIPSLAAPSDAKSVTAPDSKSAIESAVGAKAPDATSLPALKKLADTGVSLYWLGRDGGLDAWLGSRDGHDRVFYTTLDGKTLISGVVFDENGQSLTLTQVERGKAAGIPFSEATLRSLSGEPAETASPHQAHTAAPIVPPEGIKASPGETLLKEVSAAHWFSVGNKNAPPVYIFVDPTCPYCKKYYQEMVAGPVTKGQVQLRLVPVGALSEESLNLASDIMNASDPAKAWDQILAGNTQDIKSKGNDASLAKVAQNTELMLRWKIQGVPFTVYNGTDNKVKIVAGKPADIQALSSTVAR